MQLLLEVVAVGGTPHLMIATVRESETLPLEKNWKHLSIIENHVLTPKTLSVTLLGTFQQGLGLSWQGLELCCQG